MAVDADPAAMNFKSTARLLDDDKRHLLNFSTSLCGRLPMFLAKDWSTISAFHIVALKVHSFVSDNKKSNRQCGSGRCFLF